MNFFRQLAVLQDREWFKAHQADYEALWRQPMTELFDELHLKLAHELAVGWVALRRPDELRRQRRQRQCGLRYTEGWLAK
ncbi:MAG: DUF2461 family protein [Myxococcales bacterium]|nr:DUF2461 family protein [Myxococcales bacterium]